MSSPHQIPRRRLLAGSVAAAAVPLTAAIGAPAQASPRPRPRPRPASLELDPRSYLEIDADVLRTQNAHYPRIKRMRNGHFILFYQDSQYAWSNYWTTSPDLRSWARPQLLNANRPILDGAEDRCYASPDGCVLDNGDVLTVCSFRANERFSSHMELDGIMLRRSTDHGRSWGQEQVIYVGANWEPFIHQTAGGEVQVYFTQIAPKVAAEQTKGSTGVAIIRSRDRGRSWTPDVREFPWAADRVAQQYTQTSEAGVKMFTDQMPSALQIGCGGQIALAMESHLANDDYMISLAHTSANWPDRLGVDESGPADRQDNLFLGAGPYLAQFPSGETVLSYNQASRQQVRLGDHQARSFGDAEVFLPGEGYWGSIEVISHRQLVTTMANVRSDGNRIMIGVLELVRG